MRIPRALVAAFFAAASMPLALAANVVVTHGDPDRFTDAGDRSSDPVKVMKDLEGFLKKLGDKYLPANAALRLEVIDLDRAGRPHMNLPTEIRVMSGKSDFPCIDMRYTLESDGQASQARRERVCDMDYLTPLGTRGDEHDPLVYEKRMLEKWFRERFSRASSAPPGSRRP
jgi:hypothetical protein